VVGRVLLLFRLLHLEPIIGAVAVVKAITHKSLSTTQPHRKLSLTQLAQQGRLAQQEHLVLPGVPVGADTSLLTNTTRSINV
jgi:hypothetical protein